MTITILMEKKLSYSLLAGQQMNIVLDSHKIELQFSEYLY
jgi:hypothetical protein